MRYFRTGDIGELVGKGQVKIIDRVKQLFKLQQGVFVAPQPVEEVLSESEFVRQIFVWGKSSMAAVAAVVVPESSSLMCDERESERRVLQSLRELGATRTVSPTAPAELLSIEALDTADTAPAELGAGGSIEQA